MKNILSKQKYQIYFIAITALYFIVSSFIPRESETEAETHSKIIIWNDDEESIPAEGEAVIIEFERNDTIYIGSLEANKN